jgi:hypothetical protein
MTTSPAPNPIYALDVIGCIAYSDQFKGIHHTRFCFMGKTRVGASKEGDAMFGCPINQNAD